MTFGEVSAPSFGAFPDDSLPFVVNARWIRRVLSPLQPADLAPSVTMATGYGDVGTGPAGLVVPRRYVPRRGDTVRLSFTAQAGLRAPFRSQNHVAALQRAISPARKERSYPHDFSATPQLLEFRRPDSIESRRGHHRNWTGGSGQQSPERSPPGELVDPRAGRRRAIRQGGRRRHGRPASGKHVGRRFVIGAGPSWHGLSPGWTDLLTATVEVADGEPGHPRS